MTLTDATARWFQDRRGIARETLEAFGVRTEDEGVTLPYPDGMLKHRKTLEKVDGAHKMWFDPRSPDGRQRLFLPPDWAATAPYRIVFEGESDTMAAWQAAGADARAHICGIGGANAFGPKGLTDEKIAEYFDSAKLVFFVMDNEDPYKDAKAYESVERAKKAIRLRLGAKARFVELPGSCQDAAEFFQQFDWAAFSVLLGEARKINYHFKALDFSQERPEREWMVEGLFGKGEIILVSGDGGSGKSLWLQDLVAHITRGEATWMGKKLDAERVMVIDQENNDVEVWDRMYALQFDREAALEKLRYIWYQSILLDDPETVAKLYEDVSYFLPDVLILDSLSRMHVKNENENAEMNALINGAIYPLARQLGITVIIIHHVRKDGRTRGATSIRNSVDLSLDVSLDDDRLFQTIRPDKPRSITADKSSFIVRQKMDDNDHIILTTEQEDTPY